MVAVGGGRGNGCNRRPCPRPLPTVFAVAGAECKKYFTCQHCQLPQKADVGVERWVDKHVDMRSM